MEQAVYRESMSLKGSGGFTLVEVLVAMFILSVGLMAVAGLQTTAISGNSSAKDLTVAVQLAEEMIDRIGASGGNSPWDYNGLDTSNCNALSGRAQGDCNQWKARLEDPVQGLGNVTGTVAVTRNSPINYTATVTVTVSWRSSSRRVVLRTIVETWVT